MKKDNTKDYYKTLGVDKNATEDEIKTAYKTLIKEHHPDKGGDEEKIKELNVAYETLIDKDKEIAYDYSSQPHPPNFNSGGGFSFNMNNPFGGGINIDDIINQMRGQHNFRWGDGNKNTTFITQINRSIDLSFNDYLSEKDIELDVPETSQKINFKLPPEFKSGDTYQIELNKDNRNRVIINLRVNISIPNFTSEQKKKLKEMLYNENEEKI